MAAAHHHAHQGGQLMFGSGNPALHPQIFDEMVLEEKPKWDLCGENYIHVDRFFLVAMPLLFLIFNIVYWFAYGSHFILSQNDDEVIITEIP